MNEKVLATLEFNKITERVAGYAFSDSGKEMCRKLVPMTDAGSIRTAQRQTGDGAVRIRKKAAPSYSGFKNILPSLRRLAVGSILTCRELLEISCVLDTAASMRSFLSPKNEDDEPDSLSSYYEALLPVEILNNEIKRCISGYDEIADDASPALKDIRRRMTAANLKIQRSLSSLVASASMKTYLQDSIVTMRDGRYCIPVKLEHKNHVPGMVHDTSSSGNTVFIEPMSVVRLNNELKELSLSEAAEIQVILSDLSSMTAVYSQELELDYNLLTELDFILAKARYSEEIRGCVPGFSENGFISLKKARHPLLDIKTAVPISVELGKDFSMLIVTGPNTGGKTVSLKTVGLLTLMGQAGLNIPALDGSVLGIFNEVYADIGDEQSIEQSLSTFSSHMTNIVKILDRADSDSLVLLDELCSGTDPAEGAALAQSILTRLNQYGAKCMATTHYSELKVFAVQTKGVQNACCEFDVETLRPTYRLLIGLPGKSNAFAISEKLGLDKHIIDEARARIPEENIAFEDLLAEIEINKKKAELERNEARAALSEANALKTEYKKEKAELESRRADILENARREAYDVLQEAKDCADLTIKEIRRVSKDSDLKALERTRTEAGKKAKTAREQLGGEHKKPAPSGKKVSAGELIIGQRVHVVSMNATGSITSLPNQKGQVNVQLGIMNMKVNVSDLELAADEAAAAHASGGNSAGHLRYTKSMEVSGELKLLGLTVDDALIELDKYLDDAQVAHLSSVRIVHGKGTGALRNAVRAKLRCDRRVKSFRQAEYGEGDAGVTIVEFK